MITGLFIPRGTTLQGIAPWPMVRAYVYIPRLNAGGMVFFLIDTGADKTCIHATDSLSLGIDPTKLTNITDIGGVGGNAKYGRDVAGLTFLDTEGKTVLEVVELHVGVLGQSPNGTPSLLGRDILSRYRLIMDIKASTVALL